MADSITETRRKTIPLASFTNIFQNYGLRLLGLMVVDAFALLLLYQLIRDEVWPLAIAIAVVTVFFNITTLVPRLYPFRWMSPSLVIIMLMVLYPILFTVYTAFTNYSDGHLLTKAQAIDRLGKDIYIPEGGSTFTWSGYLSPEGDIVLWLVDGEGQSYLAEPNQPLVPFTPDMTEVGPLDSNGFPETIAGYERLELRDILPILDSELSQLEFGELPYTVKIKTIKEAAQLQQRYVYDEAKDALLDQSTGILYYADPEEGFFTSEEGENLIPGYQVVIGFENFARLFTSPALRGPFVQVFAWTVAFAFFSVLTTFALGLFLAVVFNDPAMRGRKIIRTLLILPYAIPGILGILIWRGMLNPHFGVITTNMVELFGWAPGWFTDPYWSKIGILIVNLWLGFPYMMLICTGALQAIPTDIYEAAEVDGAGSWKQFWRITLPLLLVSVGPLLIASFTFNFNNFVVIYAFNEGRPPIPNTPTPAGYTDILISYTYRLAFEGGRGADYGYASAITIIIFLIVAAITLFNYRFLGQWEEVSENV